MNIEQAYRAILKLAGESEIDGHWDLHAVDAAQTFFKPRLSALAEEYGSKEQIEVLHSRNSNEFLPMFRQDMLSHPNFVATELGSCVRLCLQKAHIYADRNCLWEVTIDEEEIDSFEAVDMVCAHWIKYGSEIMEMKDPDAECEMAI